MKGATLKKFIAGAFVLMLMVAGCGLVEKTTTVTKTVTATPSPTASAAVSPEPSPTVAEPYFNESDLAGITAMEGFLVTLKHINATVSKTLDYGARTGDINGISQRMTHYTKDWVAFRKAYNASNGGEFYGGKVSRVETLLEDAASHVQKFGLGLMRVVTNGNDNAINNCAMQKVKAAQAIVAVEAELERLTTLTTESY